MSINEFRLRFVISKSGAYCVGVCIVRMLIGVIRYCVPMFGLVSSIGIFPRRCNSCSDAEGRVVSAIRSIIHGDRGVSLDSDRLSTTFCSVIIVLSRIVLYSRLPCEGR